MLKCLTRCLPFNWRTVRAGKAKGCRILEEAASRDGLQAGALSASDLRLRTFLTFVLLALSACGCFSPPGSHSLDVINRSPDSVQVTLSYKVESDGKLQEARKELGTLESGEVRTAYLWASGRGTEISVLARGATDRTATWSSNQFPDVIAGREPSGKAAVVISDTGLQLRKERMTDSIRIGPAETIFIAIFAATVLVCAVMGIRNLFRPRRS